MENMDDDDDDDDDHDNDDDDEDDADDDDDDVHLGTLLLRLSQFESQVCEPIPSASNLKLTSSIDDGHRKYGESFYCSNPSQAIHVD